MRLHVTTTPRLSASDQIHETSTTRWRIWTSGSSEDKVTHNSLPSPPPYNNTCEFTMKEYVPPNILKKFLTFFLPFHSLEANQTKLQYLNKSAPNLFQVVDILQQDFLQNDLYPSLRRNYLTEDPMRFHSTTMPMLSANDMIHETNITTRRIWASSSFKDKVSHNQQMLMHNKGICATSNPEKHSHFLFFPFLSFHSGQTKQNCSTRTNLPLTFSKCLKYCRNL